MERRGARWLGFLCLLALLPGCSLLPREKQRPQAPLLEQGQVAEYTYATVQRGTVTDLRETRAIYSAAESEELAFADPSLPLEAVLVGLGDTVTAGQLLAAQETSDLQEELQQLETEQALVQLEQTYCERRQALAAARSALGVAQTEDFALTLQLIGLEQQTLQAQIDEIGQKLAARQLVAGMDGTVTALSADRTRVTVSDLASCRLLLEPEDAADFPPGTEVSVEVDTQSCAGVIHSGEDGSVYVELAETALLDSGSRYTVSYIAQQAEDTLYIPLEALRSVDGRSCVSLLDADGLPVTQEVETGLAGSGVVEILSGLQEGQRVIVEQ